MNVRKFIAATAREALHKVKELLGPDAIILSNRAIPGGVEIMAVASVEMEMILPKAAPARDKPKLNDDYTVRLSSALNNAAPREKIPASSPLPSLASRPAPKLDHVQQIPAKQQAEIVPAEVLDEIRSLRKMFEQHLAGAAWGESARSEPVKTEILRQMLDAGFSPKFARELLAELPKDLSAAKALSWVKERADRSLITISAESDIVDRGGVYALVGPTGVGKTTTTAKLAARCVLRHGANKVALITTDGYRIGAYEQLRIYGRILGVSVYLVKDAQELKQTLNDLQHKHMVLIDTMGMSQRDRMVEEQVAMFGDSNVKRLLLLSATVRGDTLDDVVRSYMGSDLAGCILSKVDEAASLASALDVIIRNGLPLHYVSNGQRVPEDLHLPNRAYLLHRAFKDVPESSPHRLDGLEPGLMMSSSGAQMTASGGLRG
jgi:flagellar biosynthesis protein FlhF